MNAYDFFSEKPVKLKAIFFNVKLTYQLYKAV